MVNICYFAYIPLIFIVPWLVYELWKYQCVKRGDVNVMREDRRERGEHPPRSRGRIRYDPEEGMEEF